jgi:cytosine/adenosine deaminase-related metal-dependent hydrolase
VCTGIGGDMFTAMRTTLAMQRALDNDRVISGGGTPERLELTARDVLEFATIQGARTLGLADRTGSVTPGKAADLVLLRTDQLNMLPVNNPVASVALAANTCNIDMVLVRGAVLKRGGELTGVDLAEVRKLAEASRDRLIAANPGAALGGKWQPSADW